MHIKNVKSTYTITSIRFRAAGLTLSLRFMNTHTISKQLNFEFDPNIDKKRNLDKKC